ncbi:MAG: hypothetical protein LBS83_03365 [Holosporales bacterium]|jgi:hypothetical protein|nr:hypothetical protein [Holosporales bacterium]
MFYKKNIFSIAIAFFSNFFINAGQDDYFPHYEGYYIHFNKNKLIQVKPTTDHVPSFYKKKNFSLKGFTRFFGNLEKGDEFLKELFPNSFWQNKIGRWETFSEIPQELLGNLNCPPVFFTEEKKGQKSNYFYSKAGKPIFQKKVQLKLGSFSY